MRVYNPFACFPNNCWQQGRYLGVAEDVGDNLIYIVEIDQGGKKSILTRSVVQEMIPDGIHLPRVRLNYAPS